MSDRTDSHDAAERGHDSKLRPLLMVTAPQLFAAVEEMPNAATLRNGVEVTRAQLQRAAEILRDGPQPVCNGLKSDMPGFIDREQNRRRGRSLVFTVGILPSHTYRITKAGRATEVESDA